MNEPARNGENAGVLQDSTQPDLENKRKQVEALVREMRWQQNLLLGILGGVAGAAVGAGIWAIITAVTQFQIGWMAVGVGFLVGFGVRWLGKGVDPVFGVVGAVLALLGCLAGNLLSVCIMISQNQGIALTDVLSRLDPSLAARIMSATFDVMDLLFYGIAIYEGYKFSFRQLTREELVRIAQN